VVTDHPRAEPVRGLPGLRGIVRLGAERARRVAALLWTGVRATQARLAAHRRRRVAAVLYAELFKLSDAGLRRRGLSRGDLHRWTRDAAED
jgi:hypothetical protein